MPRRQSARWADLESCIQTTTRAGAILVLLAAAALSASSLARAGDTNSQRARTFERLPDWTGIWENQEIRQALIGAARSSAADPAAAVRTLFRPLKLFGHPPYTPEWERKYEIALHDVAALSQTGATGKSCNPPSFPFAMEWESLFQVIIVPEQTLIVFDNGAVRHIRTTGLSHPAPGDLWPTKMGDSVGHWEGSTLVIDTIERTPGPLGFGQGADLSERAHFTERLQMIDADALEDDMTIEDPLRFTGPWSVKLIYRRVKNLDRMIAWDCDNDRNPVVNGKLVIAPPPSH